MKALWLLIKNLLYTLFVPGVLVGWVPLRWFERHARMPEIWHWPQWTAVALAAVAGLLYFASLWFLAVRGQGTPLFFDPPKKLVRRGPYKWVRNPMYLAYYALVGGEGLFLWSAHIAVYFVCLLCVGHLVVILYEEYSLRMRFGAMYEDYRRDVPRWVPRKPRPKLETIAPFDFRR